MQSERSVRLAMRLALTLLLCSCRSDAPLTGGPKRCEASPQVRGASACALLTGYAVDSQGRIMDGLEGSLRPSAQCQCSQIALQFDERGIFSATVYRVPSSAGGTAGDTATVTAVLLATAAKYPRHVTGAPYFDTASVVLRFAALGEAPIPQEVRLKISIPTGGR